MDEHWHRWERPDPTDPLVVHDVLPGILVGRCMDCLACQTVVEGVVVVTSNEASGRMLAALESPC